jgi:alkylation response protein AidB-like acyl-CoA dehydrogenase
MNFLLSAEQAMLKESVNRLLDNLEETAPPPESIWTKLAEMGLLALNVPDDHGGLGSGAVETMIVSEALGRHLVSIPYAATAVFSARALAADPRNTTSSDLLPRIADGSARVAFAHVEKQARHDQDNVAANARQAESGWVLNGQKTLVVDAPNADALIVSARLSGHQRDQSGLGLFVVRRDAQGLSLRDYSTQDGTPAGDVGLSNVKVSNHDLLGLPGEAFAIIETAIHAGIAAQCAEAVGIMDRMFTLTLSYLKTRKQFGVAIGSFQALQHRMAEMLVTLEQARSMAHLATLSLDAEPGERRRMISAAKVQIGNSARFVGRQAVQLHGGIAITLDYPVGQLYRRLTVLEALFGDTQHHLSQLGEQGGLFAPGDFARGQAA